MHRDFYQDAAEKAALHGQKCSQKQDQGGSYAPRTPERYPPRSPHELKKIAKDAARHAKLASEEAQTSKDKLSEVARISEQSAADAARLADECNLLKSELQARCAAVDMLKVQVDESHVKAIQEANEQLSTRSYRPSRVQ